MAVTSKQFQKLLDENKELHARLAQAEMALQALRKGEVEALVISSDERKQIDVTEKAGRLYQVMLEAMQEGAAALTFDGLILYSNPRLAEMLRYPLEKVQGAWLSQFLNSTDWMRIRHLLELEPATSKYLEASLQLGGGGRMPVHLTFGMAQVQEMSTIVMVVSDQTEHQQLEQALRDSEALYRTLVESSEASIAVLDREGVYLFANTELAQNLGKAPEDIAGMRMEDFFPPEAVRHQLEQVRQVLASQQGQVYESISLVQGRPRLYRTSVQPILSASGKPVLVLVHAVDITEARLAKEQVAASAVRFLNLFENTPVALLEMNITGFQKLVDGLHLEGVKQARLYASQHPEQISQAMQTVRVENVNREALVLFAAENKLELFNNWQKLTGPEMGGFFLASLQGLSEQRKELSFEGTVLTFTGGRKNIIGWLEFEQRDQEFYLLVAFTDITERKKSETALKRLNRALSMLNECNSALVHADNEASLLHEVCRLIIESGGYRMAWVGLAEQDAAQTVRPAAICGFDDGYLDQARISWGDNERGRGPTGTAIREGTVQVNHNFATNPKMEPWREAALKRDYQSSIVLPLKDEKTTFGALTLYATIPDAFDEDETRLLSQLANDLAFGVTALRTRRERQRLEETARKWAHVFEHARWGVVVSSADLQTIELMNPEFAHMHGYSVEELTGKPILDVFAPEARAELNAQLQLAHETGHNVFESVHLCKDGTTFPVVVDVTAVKDESGNVLYRAVNVRDISERKLGEQALQEREARLRVLFNILPAGVAIIDNQRHMKDMNPALSRILKQTPEGLMAGEHIKRRYLRENGTPMPVQEFPSSIAIHEQREVHDVTMGVVVEDGSIVWVSISAAPLPGEGAVTATSDISERMKAEMQTKFQAKLLNDVSDAVITTDMQLNVTSWNAAAEAMYGWQAEEVLGRPLTPFIRNEYIGTTREEVTAAVLKNGVWRGELFQYKWDGQVMNVLSSVSLVYDLLGERAGFVAINHDITERKRFEQELQQANLLLEQRVAERTAELRESEQRFRLALEHAPVTVAAQDKDLHFIWAYNQRTVDPTSVLGKTDLDVFPPETAERLVALKRKVLESGENIHEQMWVSSGGRRVFLDLYLDPMRDEAGQISGVRIATVDLTERKLVEEALVQSQSLHHQSDLLEHISEAVYSGDMNSTVRTWNRAAEEMFGYSAVEMIGKNCHELLKSEIQGSMDDMMQTLEREGCWRGEVLQTCKDGRTIRVRGSVSLLKDAQGNPTGLLSINQEIGG